MLEWLILGGVYLLVGALALVAITPRDVPPSEIYPHAILLWPLVLSQWCVTTGLDKLQHGIDTLYYRIRGGDSDA